MAWPLYCCPAWDCLMRTSADWGQHWQLRRLPVLVRAQMHHVSCTIRHETNFWASSMRLLFGELLHPRNFIIAADWLIDWLVDWLIDDVQVYWDLSQIHQTVRSDIRQVYLVQLQTYLNSLRCATSCLQSHPFCMLSNTAQCNELDIWPEKTSWGLIKSCSSDPHMYTCMSYDAWNKSDDNYCSQYSLHALHTGQSLRSILYAIVA